MTSSNRLIELAVLPLAWAGGIFAALLVGGRILVNDHSLCGPWGCGPTTDTLIAVHLAWAAAILPPVVYLPGRLGWSQKAIASSGIVLAIAGLIGLATVCGWQWFVWRPSVSETFRPYTWQRCAFVLAGMVDWPILQTLAAGVYMLCRLKRIGQRRGIRPQDRTTAET